MPRKKGKWQIPADSAPRSAWKEVPPQHTTIREKLVESMVHHEVLVEALRSSEMEALPQTYREMLIAAMPWCLGVPVGERHESQAAVVEMIGAALRGVQPGGMATSEAESAAAEAAEKRKGELDSQVEAAAEAVTAADAAVEHTESFEKASRRGLEAMKGASATCRHAHRVVVAELKNQEVLQEQLEKALQVQLPAVRAEGAAAGIREELGNVVTHLGTIVLFDEALLAALPFCLKKETKDRQEEDTRVLAQLEKALQTELKEAIRSVAWAKKATKEVWEKVDAADDECKNIEAEIETRGALATKAVEAQQTAKTVSAEAEAAKEAFQSEYKAATAVRDKKAAEVAKWGRIVTLFDNLKISKPAEAAAPAEPAAEDAAGSASVSDGENNSSSDD